MLERNIYLDGIFGLVVGDALGVPVESETREKLRMNPVINMREYGTYNLPRGTWSDDSSMTLATLDSLISGYNLEDIMDRFVIWMLQNKYTAIGKNFDMGFITRNAISKYILTCDLEGCGGYLESSNGNGSLMRILPICLYLLKKKDSMSDKEKLHIVHQVSGLTHRHVRSKMACGLYYFCVRAILESHKSLHHKLQEGIQAGLKFYQSNSMYVEEHQHFLRLADLDSFRLLDKDEIKSTGYVVDSLEAAIWCLITTENYRTCVLKAVNLGRDTDTVAAIAGGLAGLEYGYDAIPKEWVEVIARREWIYEMCCRMTISTKQE